MLSANVCAGFIRSCYGEFWEWHFWCFLASLLCPVCLEGGASLASPPVPPAGHAFSAEFGGCITFVITGGSVRLVMMHVWFIGLLGHFGEFVGKNNVSPLFVLLGFFCFVGILGFGFEV